MRTFSLRHFLRLKLVFIFFLFEFASLADTTIGPWTALFKGIDYCAGTNVPGGGGFAVLQVAHAFRVDLADPDVQLFPTPRITNYFVNDREVAGLTISDFLRTNGLQIAINANFFDSNGYYVPAGTPMDVYGLQICQGIEVSPQQTASHAYTIAFSTNNQSSYYTNWPIKSNQGIYTAVAGNKPLVVAGKNAISRNDNDRDPRTAFGISQDGRYLYLLGIDGRQPGYSSGSSDYETAQWMLLLGAYNAINMDGGGSTTLVMEDSTKIPIRLNQSSAVADSGKERTVGSHFGVYAKPLPGFINDVNAFPDDTTVKITWTTVEPATSEVLYGLTSDVSTSSGVVNTMTTNHMVQLSGLTPSSTYYYRVASSTDGQRYVSSVFRFITTNYVTSIPIFDITNTWKYSTASQSDTSWTSSNYDDSSWGGPGPGLLWVDVRATGPNTLVNPKNTQMPADPSNNGYPFVTYYFRTSFSLDHVLSGSAIEISGFIDDGAIFYLNGTEVYRLRVPASAGNKTLASSYPCEGDATCLDQFTIPASALKNLVVGKNVIAAEVHNYNLRSADITFGISMNLIEPISRSAKLNIQQSSGSITLSWNETGFVLESAETLQGPWTVVEASNGSPYTISSLPSSRFYRLRK